MLVLGAWVFFLGWEERARVTALMEEGAQAVGEVVRVEIEPRRNQSELDSYLPVVAWETTGGQRIVARTGFGAQDPQAFHVGDRFPVYYDPADPEGRFYVPYPGSSPVRVLMDNLGLIIGGVFLLGGISMLRAGLKI